MCGRFSLTLPSDAMAQLFAATPDNNLPDVPDFNVCPTMNVHTISADDTGRRLRAMRWGFVPKWYKALNDGPLLINARGETIAEKPAFRSACRQRRCLIAATGFYEWTKTSEGARLPWYISRKDGGPLAFAGVWQDWTGDDHTIATCAIVTVAAETSMQVIHKRMPLILEPADWAKWLGENGKGAAVLMRPPSDDRLMFHRVSTDINSNLASGAGLIDPIPGR